MERSERGVDEEERGGANGSVDAGAKGRMRGVCGRGVSGSANTAALSAPKKYNDWE